MVAIAGEAPSLPTGVWYDAVPAPRAGSSEQRIAEAFLTCVARWGPTKTTVEDIAREAGVSRATVYRLYPGGKSAIATAAARSEALRLVSTLDDGLAGVDDPEERLSLVLCIAATFFVDHEALSFLRRHEPAEFERLVGLDRLEVLLEVVGRSVGPLLRPVLASDDQARAAAIWLGRIVASHVVAPSPTLQLTDVAQARQLVRTHVLPGLVSAGHLIDPSTRTPHHEEHHHVHH